MSDMDDREVKEVESLFHSINRWDDNGIVVPFWCPFCQRHRSEIGDSLSDWVVCKECYNERVLF